MKSSVRQNLTVAALGLGAGLLNGLLGAGGGIVIVAGLTRIFRGGGSTRARSLPARLR